MAPRRETLNSEVEEALLSDVPGYDEEFGNNQVDDNDELDAGDDDTKSEVKETQDADGVDEADDAGKQQRQEQQEVKYDAQGNVIDSRGNIIAPAGRARRLDEQNKRYKGLLENSNKQVVKLRQDLASQNFLNGAPKRLGLTYDETAAAMDMMKQFKENPAQFVQIVLAEVAARGVDLNRLLGERAGMVQTDAIKRMLDERMKPFEERTKRETEQAQLTRSVEDRYNNFMARYPDAEPHQDAIAELMRTEQASDEREAYFMVREFALRNRLDFTQPLGPQIVEKVKQSRGNPDTKQQQPNGSPRRPMVRGNMPDRQMTQRETKIASPDRSYASIIDEAMAEAGFEG